MAGALGENYKAQIAVSGVLTEIDCQGDLTFDPGFTLEQSRTKNCTHPFFRESGATAQFTVELENPPSAAQTEIIDATYNKSQTEVAIVSSDTGMPKWQGNAYISFSPLTAPTEGIATIQVQFSFINDPTRSTS